MRVKSNLDEILYGKILESLLGGEYSMGQKLSPDELSEKFEVSRTPVVQALKMLSKDGILTVMPNGRVHVPEYEKDLLAQVCEVRRLVEEYALSVVMKDEEKRTFAYEEMLPCADKCREYMNSKCYVQLAMEDLKFHRSLVKAAGNKVMCDLYTGVQGRFIVANYLARPLKDRDYEGTVAEHYGLLEAVHRGDASDAHERLLKHIGGIKLLSNYDEKE